MVGVGLGFPFTGSRSVTSRRIKYLISRGRLEASRQPDGLSGGRQGVLLIPDFIQTQVGQMGERLLRP